MANPVLKTTVKKMSGGVNANTGTGQINQLTVSGSWAVGDHYTFVFTDSLSGVQTQIGADSVDGVTGLIPTFLRTLKLKMNFIAGTKWFFSAVNLPTTFNDPNALTNGSIPIANSYATPENLLALMSYQGKMMISGRNSAQVWTINADPDLYDQQQPIDNAPCLAKLAVQGLGELDVLYLSDTGFRSFKVKDVNLNAVVTDIGSPIDLAVQSLLLGCTDAEKAAACGIVDPFTGMYLCFVKNVMYALAYFPQAKVVAWSTWKPTYQATNLSRIVNTDVAVDYDVKFGLTDNSDHANQGPYTLVHGGGLQNNILPAVYLFFRSTGITEIWSSVLITGGLAFQGVIDIGAATFTPNQTVFTPQKFAVLDGRILARTSDSVYIYGGADRNTYDNAIGVAETSWLDGDSPVIRKAMEGVDVTQSGHWHHFGSMDYLTGEFTMTLNNITNSTFDGGRVTFSSEGTHMKWRAQTVGALATAAQALLSSIIFNFNISDDK